MRAKLFLFLGVLFWFLLLVLFSTACAGGRKAISKEAVTYYAPDSHVTKLYGCKLPPPHADYELLRCRATPPDVLQCVYKHALAPSYVIEVAVAITLEMCAAGEPWVVIGVREIEAPKIEAHQFSAPDDTDTSACGV